MATSERISGLAQQDFLRFAMKQLGMGRDDFARRVSLATHTLDRMLLPSESPEFRSMPETGRSYIGEILKWGPLVFSAISDGTQSQQRYGW